MQAALFVQLSWPQWRHHPWQRAAALLAVMLGVALAFSVQLINESALSELGTAVRAVNGEPDFRLRAASNSGFDEALYARVAAHPQVALAGPRVEGTATAGAANGRPPVTLQVIGLDALSAATLAPALLARLPPGADRLDALDPGALALNASASRELGAPAQVTLQTPQGQGHWRVRGHLAAPGAPLAVMDIAGAQAAFGAVGRLSAIDVRLVAGADREQVIQSLGLGDFAAQGVYVDTPGEAAQRSSMLSRAYRVNLMALALVALFTGTFLVFSVFSLSVARRLPELALLGVLGLTPAERLRLVLLDALVLGLLGSGLGLALGASLAVLALRVIGADLGGGYFPGGAATLHFNAWAAAAYGLLGVAAACAGAWLPAQAARRIAPAQTLKSGSGAWAPAARHNRWGPRALVLGTALCFAPPVNGLPLGAYAAIALLLTGGMACMPQVLTGLLWLAPRPRSALLLLAVERARHQRQAAAIAVAGVVASLSLAVALTVMVGSFRSAIIEWLDVLLPADLYVRTAGQNSGAGAARNSQDNANDLGGSAALPAAVISAAAEQPGVRRVEAQRVVLLQWDATHPAVALIARPLNDPAAALPLAGPLLPPAADGTPAVYLSEAMALLYGLAPGARLALPLPTAGAGRANVYVRGLWRDYARQFGAIALDQGDYVRLSGDTRVDTLALWLAPGADVAGLQAQLRRRAGEPAGASGTALEFTSPGDIRALSLRLFDRSFAVTYWLQAVAIAIGLFGIAASFSAQVLARRKEFGVLAHLGLTPRQLLGLVAAEGAVWTAAGALLGLALGIAVSAVLVKVVNPQSFHWTMPLHLPALELACLTVAVVVAASATAWLTARGQRSRRTAQGVKDDW